MKISYITMQWPVASETFAARDVVTLSKMGHDVDVSAMRPDNRDVNDLIRSFGIQDIACLRMDYKAQVKGMVAMLRHFPKVMGLCGALLCRERNVVYVIKSLLLLPAVFRIFDHLLSRRPDVVHLFWGHYPAMVGWLVLRYLPHIKLTHFLGPYDLNYHYALSVSVSRRAVAVFTHVEGNRSALQALGIDRDKIVVVYRGIDMTATQMAKPDNPASIIFTGRLLKEKGIFEMLDVMQQVLTQNPSAHLTVIGDGEDRAVFEVAIQSRHLADHITLTGWLSPSDVLACLSRASVMLFLSHSERLPNAVKEAMACGIVPVSSRTVGIEEMIEDGVDGYIISDIRDSRMIAEKIVALINDRVLHADMAQKARQKILDRFDVMAAMKQYVAVWSKQ